MSSFHMSTRILMLLTGCSTSSSRRGSRYGAIQPTYGPARIGVQKFRKAITSNALVFIACFSRASVARRVSYQSEELILAIDQLRLRRPDQPWLIPVRLDDCEIPELEIGGGRTLASIQRPDLFGDRAAGGAVRLAAAVLRILGREPVRPAPTPLKPATNEPRTRRISPAPETPGYGSAVPAGLAVSDLQPVVYVVAEALSDREHVYRIAEIAGIIRDLPIGRLPFQAQVDQLWWEVFRAALDATPQTLASLLGEVSDSLSLNPPVN
jgi:hypothetical protein